MIRRAISPATPLLLLAVAACSSQSDDTTRKERDPAVSNALNEPLMADPDLANRNQGGAALTGGGPASAEVPTFNQSPEEIDAARNAAKALAGGTIPAAPEAAETLRTSRLERTVTAAAMAEALGLAKPACSARLTYTAIWAARLVAPFEVYPRGHVGESAGSDEIGCRLRVVSFVTPVSLDEVIGFYAARVRSAGFAVRRTTEGEDDVLQGAKGKQSYAVAARTRDDKLTGVTIVTSGL